MMGSDASLEDVIDHRGRRGAKRRPRFQPGGPRLETLERRDLPSGLGSDYTLMGGQWDSSRTITYSIAPDGVDWDRAANNANAALDGEYGGPGWQPLVARALQTWAAVSNLNFTRVGDGPYDFNAAGVAQGDPRFGDIRIGGYNSNNTSTIAQTYGPPPNGQTGAGDVELNTGFNFGPGSRYDLQTVLTHELGHSLGLGESPQSTSVMYSYYAGVRQALSPYDIEGIQSIYGARSADGFQAQGLAVSPSTAVDLSPALNSAGQGQLAGLSLDAIGDVEYYSVVAPQFTGATFHVAAVATGFSQLSPRISVIDPATGATLASAGDPNAYGDVALASAAGVQPGHRYLIAVTGATHDVFAVGSYGIAMAFLGGTPITPPPDPFAYNNTFATATNLGVDTDPTLLNLTLPSAMNYQVFAFQSTRPGLVLVGSLGARAIVIGPSGRTLATGMGLIGFNSAGGAGPYYLVVLSPNGTAVSNYSFAVRTPGGSGTGGGVRPAFAPGVGVSAESVPDLVAVAPAVSNAVPAGPLKKASSLRR